MKLSPGSSNAPEGLPKEGLYMHIIVNLFSFTPFGHKPACRAGPCQVACRTHQWIISRRSRGPDTQSIGSWAWQCHAVCWRNLRSQTLGTPQSARPSNFQVLLASTQVTVSVVQCPVSLIRVPFFHLSCRQSNPTGRMSRPHGDWELMLCWFFLCLKQRQFVPEETWIKIFNCEGTMVGPLFKRICHHMQDADQKFQHDLEAAISKKKGYTQYSYIYIYMNICYRTSIRNWQSWNVAFFIQVNACGPGGWEA